jgi:hypothetical protein
LLAVLTVHPFWARGLQWDSSGASRAPALHVIQEECMLRKCLMALTLFALLAAPALAQERIEIAGTFGTGRRYSGAPPPLPGIP